MLVRSSEQLSIITARDQDNQVNSESLVPMAKFRETDSELSGKGTRLGTAYRLQTGEIVYAPD